MRSRRRGGNPLLWRMIGVGVLITIGLLPVLAYLGAFKAGKNNGPLQVTLLPPPPPVPPAPHHAAAKKPTPHKVASHSGSKTPQAARPLPVHVAAATGGTSNGENAIVNGTNTNIGKQPLPTPSGPPVPPRPIIQPQPKVTPPVTPPQPVQPAPKPTPPVVPPLPPPHVPVIVAAVPIAEPQPDIPDDLRDDDLNATCGVLLTIDDDGTVSATKEKSSGNGELDQAALEAVKRWRFKPATKDGVPATSYLHVDIDFQVS